LQCSTTETGIARGIAVAELNRRQPIVRAEEEGRLSDLDGRECIAAFADRGCWGAMVGPVAEEVLERCPARVAADAVYIAACRPERACEVGGGRVLRRADRGLAGARPRRRRVRSCGRLLHGRHD
jgi:hypothetical protein